jgi:hypothetical protein
MVFTARDCAQTSESWIKIVSEAFTSVLREFPISEKYQVKLLTASKKAKLFITYFMNRIVILSNNIAVI